MNWGSVTEPGQSGLRALWTEPVGAFRGRRHEITEARPNPLPVQRAIPSWFGAGMSRGPTPDGVLKRRGSALPKCRGYRKVEMVISFWVMNSSRTGTPSRVCAIPRWSAGMISFGSVTRSP